MSKVKLNIEFENGEMKILTYKEAYKIYQQLDLYFGSPRQPKQIPIQPNFLVDGVPKYQVKPEKLGKKERPGPSAGPENWRVIGK